MFDNTQDKGYLTVRLKKTEDGPHLSMMNIFEEADETNFYVDYEDGCIKIDWGDGDPAEVIGYYENTVDGVWLAKVFDRTKNRVIGRVGEELIYFRKNEVDYSVGRYSPEEECLAYYTQNGTITEKGCPLNRRGLINGSEIGGAAAFVALFHAYNFKSIYADFFAMDYSAFKTKYAAYLD